MLFRSWDLHYAPLNVPPRYPIAAVYQNTAPDATSPWVLPGNYNVKLTVNGKTYTRPLTVKLDPRVKTAAADLKTIHDFSVQCYEGVKESMTALSEIENLKKQLKTLIPASKPPLTNNLTAFDKQLSNFETTAQGSTEPSFSRLESALSGVFNILHDTDMPPTSQTITAVNDNVAKVKTLSAQWKSFKTKELKAMNEQLLNAKMTILSW